MHLIHMAKVQAFILYRINNPRGPSKLNQLEFTRKLIQEMTSDAPPTVSFKRRLSDPPTRLMEKHFCTKVKPTAHKKYPTSICVVCSEKGSWADGAGKFYTTRKEVRTECVQCNKGLCAQPWFELYHTKKYYKQAADGGDN